MMIGNAGGKFRTVVAASGAAKAKRRRSAASGAGRDAPQSSMTALV